MTINEKAKVMSLIASLGGRDSDVEINICANLLRASLECGLFQCVLPFKNDTVRAIIEGLDLKTRVANNGIWIIYWTREDLEGTK